MKTIALAVLLCAVAGMAEASGPPSALEQRQHEHLFPAASAPLVETPSPLVPPPSGEAVRALWPDCGPGVREGSACSWHGGSCVSYAPIQPIDDSHVGNDPANQAHEFAKHACSSGFRGLENSALHAHCIEVNTGNWNATHRVTP